jgi:hypothetical protein
VIGANKRKGPDIFEILGTASIGSADSRLSSHTALLSVVVTLLRVVLKLTRRQKSEPKIYVEDCRRIQLALCPSPLFDDAKVKGVIGANKRKGPDIFEILGTASTEADTSAKERTENICGRLPKDSTDCPQIQCSQCLESIGVVPFSSLRRRQGQGGDRSEQAKGQHG